MRTQDEVEHFHNCREFSQPPQVFISGYANAREKFSIAFRKKHSLKTTKQGKDKKIHFTDQNVSSYAIYLTMAFVNWPIKIYIW